MEVCPRRRELACVESEYRYHVCTSVPRLSSSRQRSRTDEARSASASQKAAHFFQVSHVSRPDHGSLCPFRFYVILSTCSTGKAPPQPGQPRQLAVINHHPLSRGEAIRPADQQRQRPRLQMQPQPPQSLPRTFISTANPLCMLAHSAAPPSDQISHRSQLISGRSAFCILHSALCILHSAFCTLHSVCISAFWTLARPRFKPQPCLDWTSRAACLVGK